MKALRQIPYLSNQSFRKTALGIKAASPHIEKKVALTEIYCQHKFLSLYISHAKEHVCDGGFSDTIKKFSHIINTELFNFQYAIRVTPLLAESFSISNADFHVISGSVHSRLNKLPQGWKTDLYFSRFILKMVGYQEVLYQSLLKCIAPYNYRQLNYILQEMSGTVTALKNAMKIYSHKIITSKQHQIFNNL